MLPNQPEIKSIVDRAFVELGKFDEQLTRCTGLPEVPLDASVSAMIISTLCLSALDHIAAGLHAALSNEPLPPFLYFPIHEDRNKFVKALRRDFPELEERYPKVAQFLESVQPLPASPFRFNREMKLLANEYKHRSLLPLVHFAEQMKNLPQGELARLYNEDRPAYHKCFAYYDARIQFHAEPDGTVHRMNAHTCLQQFAFTVVHIFMEISHPDLWEEPRANG